MRYIVEGSIRRAGPTVRVTAQLIDTATGAHLWAERYDRTMEDVFAVQDEVVHSIVSTLEGRLAAAGAAQVRAKPTASWAAYDYFLQGRECSARYKLDEADALLARAIELDPNYAHAHAWRASTLTAITLARRQARDIAAGRHLRREGLVARRIRRLVPPGHGVRIASLKESCLGRDAS